jgi:hypothetical protein
MKTPAISRCLVALFILSGAFAVARPCAAAPAADPLSGSPVVRVDFQPPLTLPPRFRNHCAIDSASGRPYCSDHCGFEYEFYYCGEQSYGCCKIGYGYCDGHGQLRCHP